jgi:hypothetical protein
MPAPITGPFEDFEEWIRTAIGGDFEWKERPPDSVATRRTIVGIVRTLKRDHGGEFPRECFFFRRKDRRPRS